MARVYGDGVMSDDELADLRAELTGARDLMEDLDVGYEREIAGLVGEVTRLEDALDASNRRLMHLRADVEQAAMAVAEVVEIFCTARPSVANWKRIESLVMLADHLLPLNDDLARSSNPFVAESGCDDG